MRSQVAVRQVSLGHTKEQVQETGRGRNLVPRRQDKRSDRQAAQSGSLASCPEKHQMWTAIPLSTQLGSCFTGQHRHLNEKPQRGRQELGTSRAGLRSYPSALPESGEDSGGSFPMHTHGEEGVHSPGDTCIHSAEDRLTVNPSIHRAAVTRGDDW